MTSSRVRLRTQLPYLPKALALVWSAARPWTVAWGALLILQGLLPVAVVVLLREAVDALTSALQRDGSLAGVAAWGVLLGGALLAGEVLSSVASWVRAAQAELVRDRIHGLIHERAVELSLDFYESPSSYDMLHRARVDAVDQPVALLENLGRLVQNGIALAGMGVVLATYAWWLPPALLGATLPALLVAGRYVVRFHRWRLANTVRERRARYFDLMLTSQTAAAELRLFDLGPRFRAAFAGLRETIRRERFRLTLRQMLAEIAAATVGLAVMGSAFVWLALRGGRGAATLGDLAVFWQVFTQGQRLARTLLDGVGESYRNLLFLENLFEFLAVRPEVAAPGEPVPVPPLANEVRVQGVRFRYPGSDRVALDDFDLTLPAGKVVALVGENGAGKSTVVKLLCRFYDPEAGRVSVDGVDLRDLDPVELRRRITVLFQEPVRYHDTVANNIAFGDHGRSPNRRDLEEAAASAGADAPIGCLPDGYETVLGKWFGGAELSVGEWQRLALARAFLRRSPLVILDEPTSAMDSWAEADWMSRFRELVRGRTALVITHRFTTALRADVIHVMARGRIVESGNHGELLSLGGRYASSWYAQVNRS